MNIINKQLDIQTIGMFSDGSDRQYISIYKIIVEDNNHRYMLTFDHDPTDQEITDAYTSGQAVDITTPEDNIAKLEQNMKDTQNAIAELNILLATPTA